MNPPTDAMTLPIPIRYTHSRTSPNTTAAQPMNTADEYRFVTGGRPEICIRMMSAHVWTQSTNTSSQNADRLSTFVNPSQLAHVNTKAMMYVTAL
jgi:hypothetical protein